MSAPNRPGAPRQSPPRAARRPDVRPRTAAKPVRKGPTTGPIAKPQSRPGGPSGASRAAREDVPRIDPSRPKGSWTAMVTWRSAVLLVVVGLAFALVAPSVRAYMDQEAMLESLRTEAADARAEVEDLEANVARWDDPAYVVAQARERLAYVLPGETPFRVIDPETVTGHAEGSPAAERDPEALTGATWYDRLWGSVVDSGEATAPAAEGADSTADAGA
ncbi:septum formation initiator family protein [Demequina sp.]|uniref:FtsB family cell division protein n=1 Tax=Demequina sp. TaxID=2050685 RepID=UPI003A8962FA